MEAAGIVSFDGCHFHPHRALGLVGDNFSEQSIIARLPGRMAVGHNRYSTAGETAEAVAAFLRERRDDAPPFYAQVGFFETHTPYDWSGAQPDGMRAARWR